MDKKTDRIAQVTVYEENTQTRRSRRGKRLDVAAWFIFAVWMAVVLLVKKLPDGFGALGAGIIVLGMAVLRRILHVSVSSFWMIIGVVFVLAGVGEMMFGGLPFLPVALIICGLLLLFHGHSKRMS